MQIIPTFFNRDFSTRLQVPPAQYSVQQYSHAALGGPKLATIHVAPGTEALWQLLDLLRCPVEFADETGQLVWWGFVGAVTVRVGIHEFTVSLNELGNKVTVIYGLVPGAASVGHATRGTTTPASNADSVATYGIKELRVSLQSGTLQQANGLRDTVLTQRALPLLSHHSLGSGAGAVSSASIECLGWWSTLSWMNFSDVAHAENFYPDTGTDVAAVTVDAGHTRLAQSFQLPHVGDRWTVDSIAVALLVANLGFNTLSVELWSDVSGSPGVRLAGNNVDGPHLADGLNNIMTVVPMDALVTITGASPYWIVLRKPGDAIGGNNFTVRWNIFNGYARGDSKWWNGSAWSAGTGNDVFFNVNGIVETSTQIASIVAACGQFLAGTDIDMAGSGIYSNSYRFGDLRAIDEALEMLTSGTINNLRMLTTVGPDRRVRLYAEPDVSSLSLYQLPNGALLDGLDQPVRLSSCPVAVWIDQRGIVPAGVDLPNLAPCFPYFVEEATYNALTGIWLPTPRAVRSIWEVAKVRE